MDQIINWFILIIIFVFDPLAVALVIAFNNAVKVDRGIVKKDKVVRKRELYGEDDSSNDDSDEEKEWEEELTNELDNTLEDGLEDEEWDESHALDMVLNDMVEDLDEDGKIDEDINQDGIITEEEKKKAYELGNWKHSFNGKPYYLHPWFDWNKKERWINDRQAINHWLNYRGGNTTALEEIKNQYPTDFNSKTY
jgi:hypothetical protein